MKPPRIVQGTKDVPASPDRPFGAPASSSPGRVLRPTEAGLIDRPFQAKKTGTYHLVHDRLLMNRIEFIPFGLRTSSCFLVVKGAKPAAPDESRSTV